MLDMLRASQRLGVVFWSTREIWSGALARAPFCIRRISLVHLKLPHLVIGGEVPGLAATRNRVLTSPRRVPPRHRRTTPPARQRHAPTPPWLTPGRKRFEGQHVLSRFGQPPACRAWRCGKPLKTGAFPADRSKRNHNANSRPQNRPLFPRSDSETFALPRAAAQTGLQRLAAFAAPSSRPAAHRPRGALQAPRPHAVAAPFALPVPFVGAPGAGSASPSPSPVPSGRPPIACAWSVSPSGCRS
jgi:hypothetical protein